MMSRLWLERKGDFLMSLCVSVAEVGLKPRTSKGCSRHTGLSEPAESRRWVWVEEQGDW